MNKIHNIKGNNKAKGNLKDKKKLKRQIKINNNIHAKGKRSFNFYIIIILIIENLTLLVLSLIKNKEKIKNVFKKGSITSNNSSFEYDLKSHYFDRKTSLDKGLPFIRKCREGKLINNPAQFKNTLNPRISVIIPSYNCEVFLKRAVRSVQNQDMLDLEIILVNDFSNKRTVNLIEELRKEDPRIKVINNEKRKGQFYARNIGALISKGEYIINLDSDDLYMDTDVFTTLYYAIKENDSDILAHKMIEAISFSDRFYMKRHRFNDRKYNLEIFQPELSCYPISENGTWKINDVNIWGKLFKSSLYRSAVNLLGEERYTYYAIWTEDYLMLYLLCNLASSFKFVWKYGLFHKVSANSNSNKLNGKEKLFGELFFTEIIFEFGKSQCKHLSVQRFIGFIGYYKYATAENKKYYMRIYKKMIIANDVDEKFKNIIKNKLRKYTSLDVT